LDISDPRCGPLVVEEFMHLYNILLMLFDDKQNAQNRLDDFINKKPTVPAKPRRIKTEP
jgi:hypothetical protein